MEKKWYYCLLAITIVSCTLGIFFRFYRVDYKYMWVDEAITMIRICGFEDHFVQKNKIYSPEEYLELIKPTPGLSNVVKTTLRVTNQVPIYYLSLRIWGEWTNFSVFHLRLFSALFSVLNILLFSLLIREFTSDKFVQLVGISLISLSPLNVVFAQEMRNYSMWIAEFFLMNILFLRAIKSSGWNKYWLYYIFCTTLALYTHGLTVFVISIHGFYLLLFAEKRKKIYGIGSSVIACLIFSPWLFAVAKNSQMDWIMRGISVGTLGKNLLFQITTNFFDITNDIDKHILLQIVKLSVALALIFLLARAIVYAKKELELRFFGLLLCSLGIMLIFPLTDLMGLTRLSTAVKYLFPAYWVLHFLVAFYIGKNLRDNPKVFSPVLLLILVLGLSSCFYHSQNRHWWNKVVGRDSITTESVNLIHNSSKPILICFTNPALLTSVVQALPSNSDVLLLSPKTTAKGCLSHIQKYSDCFILQRNLHDEIKVIGGYSPKRVAPNLWHFSIRN